MVFMEWDNNLNTGIDVIDNQHKRIIGFINELHDCVENNDSEKVTEIIEDLLEYTLTHFAFEEELMVQCGYDLSEGHKETHNEFAAKIDEYKARNSAGDDIAKELMEELRHWLASHIQYDDSDYIPIVKASFNAGWAQKAINRLFR
jgi:hemerythrin